MLFDFELGVGNTVKLLFGALLICDGVTMVIAGSVLVLEYKVSSPLRNESRLLKNES